MVIAGEIIKLKKEVRRLSNKLSQHLKNDFNKKMVEFKDYN